MPQVLSTSLPKYRRIADELKAQIECGDLAPGDRLPTFAEMRATHATTQSTIDKVLSLLESENLIMRKPGSGVYVCEPQPTVAGTIGLVLPRFHFPKQSRYWAALLESVRDVVDEHDAQLLLLNTETLKGWEKADGILFCEWSVGDLRQSVPPQMPCVSLLAPSRSYAAVMADDYTGSRLAVEYLLELGHRRIAYLYNVDPHSVNVSRRRDAYRDTLLKSGIEPNVEWERVLSDRVWLDKSFLQSGYLTMHEWLRDGWRESGCTALLAQNDDTALGVIQALRQVGLSVPGDVSVVGFDGIHDEGLLLPRLTTVEIPLAEIGRKAVEMLLTQIRDNPLEQRQEVLPVGLRYGETTTKLTIT
jgi:DNA-binding LacI/PurR family transcriptional regulator